MVMQEEASILLSGSLTETLFENKRLFSDHSDVAKAQYRSFIELVVRPHSDLFRNFDYNQVRLDAFLFPYFGGNAGYGELWKVCQFVFIVSHGQAPIERGFNVNKEVSVVNLAKESIVCQRLVYDHVKDIGNLHEYSVPKELTVSCKGARQGYTKMVEMK